jgi:hypothetical protein
MDDFDGDSGGFCESAKTPFLVFFAFLGIYDVCGWRRVDLNASL